MFYWSLTSLVHFAPPPTFNPDYAYAYRQYCVLNARFDTGTKRVMFIREQNMLFII